VIGPSADDDLAIEAVEGVNLEVLSGYVACDNVSG